VRGNNSFQPTPSRSALFVIPLWCSVTDESDAMPRDFSRCNAEAAKSTRQNHALRCTSNGTPTRMDASLSLTRNTRNLAGIVSLALRTSKSSAERRTRRRLQNSRNTRLDHEVA
jgi:hypothetical protein